MKKFALLISLVFVAGVATAQDKKPEAPKPAEKAATHQMKAMTEKGKTHEVAAEIVSVDTVKNTVTVKGEKENQTVPVDAKVALKDLKAGEKVTMTCWDNAKGEHVKVTAIAPAKVAAPEKK